MSISKKEQEILLRVLIEKGDENLLYDFAKNHTYNKTLRKLAISYITNPKLLYNMLINNQCKFCTEYIVERISDQRCLYKLANNIYLYNPIIDEKTVLQSIAKTLKDEKYLSKFICVQSVYPEKDYFDLALGKITDISLLKKCLSHTFNVTKRKKIKRRIRELKN